MNLQTFVASDRTRIAYTVDDYTDPWREPQTLFLTHSAMSSSRRMYAMVPYLAREFRVVRMDTRGHGASQVPPADSTLSLDRLTQDLHELTEHLGVERAHFMGSAAGGYLSQQMAIHHPRKVLSAILVASKPGLRNSQAASWIPEIERKGLRPFLKETISDRFPPGTDPAQIEWFLDEVCKNDLDYIKRFILHMTGLYWMDDVAHIRCPTLIIAPGDEPIGDGSAYGEMQRRIPDCELIVYEGGRHNIGDYLGDRCAQDALAFLRRRFGQARM
ncbi:MAG: alpha/beta hydrolase [Betaproteobacteria bacterium]|nr:alpha/beta hydrolase [Betaproteobacteria bacterium]